MKHPSQIALGVLAFCSSVGSVAFAQSADPSAGNTNSSAGNPNAGSAVAMPAPDPARSRNDSDISQPTSTGVTVAGDSTSMPLSSEPHRDVVEHTWPNRHLLLSGVVVLGGSYGAAAIVGALSDRPADDKLFIPVVGPWLDLTNRDCNLRPCSNETLNKVLLVGDGALQGVGALSMVLGLVVPETSKKPWYVFGNNDLSVAPQVGLSTTGVTAFGSF